MVRSEPAPSREGGDTGPRRANERGASIMELVVASTVFAIVTVSALGSSGSFSTALNDQLTVQNQFTSSNVARMRFLGDADASTAVACPLPDRVTFSVASPPGAYLGYMVFEGKLWRYDSAIDHGSVVADPAQSLTCTDLGTDGIYVSTELGTTDLPYHLHMRISAGGGGA